MPSFSQGLQYQGTEFLVYCCSNSLCKNLHAGIKIRACWEMIVRVCFLTVIAAEMWTEEMGGLGASISLYRLEVHIDFS